MANLTQKTAKKTFAVELGLENNVAAAGLRREGKEGERCSPREKLPNKNKT
jgi:hypothetical protein